MLSERSKGQLSGLEFRVLSTETNRELAGAYVSNIYSIGENQLLRLRRSGRKGEASESSLILSPRLGAWITERPIRAETSAFTTALRSHLLRATLKGASQSDLDRVLILEFEGTGDEGGLRLVLEMMPPGNLVLVGPEGRTLISLRELRTETRRIAKGHPYSPPAQTRASLDTLTRGELVDSLTREKTLGRALGRGISLPRRYVDEILDRVSRKQEDSTEISEGEVDGIMAAITSMVSELEDDPHPCLVSAGDDRLEVMVIRPRIRPVVESAGALSPLVDRLLFADLAASGEEPVARAEKGESEEVAHERRIKEYEATISSLRAKREGLATLSSELRRLAPLVGAASDPKKAIEMAKAAKLVSGKILASLESTAERTQASISSAIFDAAKRTEREVGDIDIAIEGLQSKIKKAKNKGETTRTKAVSLTRSKKEWYEKFRWFFTTEGRLAIGGRDAQSNSTLMRRHAQEGDTVYHADLFGSPFFVLKGGKDQTGDEVRQVAKATVSFSSAWKTGLGAADAYWVAPEQVGSAGPSGEYLAHGSFAIKGKKNFVTKNPVEIAVGVDAAGRVISGPEESIMKVARGHVTLVPSREKPSDTAKKVLHELKGFLDARESPSVDDVLRMLPAGGGKVIRRRKDGETA